MSASELRDAFTVATTYLDTASIGLPPRVTQEALADVHARWAAGQLRPGDFDAEVDAARRAYAALVGVEVAGVAVGHQVAPLVGLVAAAVPDGAEVLVAEREFTSVTFPFAAHADRGVRVLEVPLAEIADHVTADTAWVAVGAVQSIDGALADLDAIEAACTRHGARTLVDLTQAAGWLPVDAGRHDLTVCGAYKWLLSPRGSAFATFADDLLELLRPTSASWFAGEQVWDSIYGLPLRLSSDARRFDVSPGWFAWTGTAASLRFVLDLGVERVHAHDLAVAAAFCEAAQLPPPRSAIVAVATDDRADAVLDELGVVAARRGGRSRLAFHLHNTADEVAAIGSALRGHVRVG